MATRADDGRSGTCGESAGHPAVRAVEPGADAEPGTTVVEPGHGPARAKRARSVEVLGRGQVPAGFTPLEARAGRAFGPGAGDDTVTLTRSTEGGVLIGPGSRFVADRWRHPRAVLRPAEPHPAPGVVPSPGRTFRHALSGGRADGGLRRTRARS
ncbi:hypothetical protein ADK58_03365 [Streptomyces sp. XY152]|nr:hypothetical protein ADK58_03365 [Streptomyces sp. XY152]